MGDIFRPDEGVAQFGRNRCLAKDFENLAETLATFVTLASIQPVLRRLARAEVLKTIAPGYTMAKVGKSDCEGDLRRSVRQ